MVVSASMPVPNKRKSSPSRAKRRSVTKFPIQTVGNERRIRPKVFDLIKGTKDFETLVKIGRLHNVLAYMMQLHTEVDADLSTPTGRRTYHRNLVNLGGYLFEGLRLFQSLRISYKDEPAFDLILRLLTDRSFSRRYAVMQKIRNNLAFHLESENHMTQTSKALNKIKLPYYTLLSAVDNQFGSLYFDIADTVDLNFLLDELKTKTDTDEKAIYSEITTMLTSTLAEMAKASERFGIGLLVRLNLSSIKKIE